MDEMKLNSKLLKSFASRLLSSFASKKIDKPVDISLRDFNCFVSDEKAHVHIELDADLSKADLGELLGKIGI